MIVSKKRFLEPILKSKNGVHLTAYIPKPKNSAEFQERITEISLLTLEYLAPVYNQEQIDSFLEPIQNLVKDMSLIKSIQGNIGIFKTKDTLRVLSLPIQVDFNCIVADSFHIKPLLRWAQNDQDFIFVGLTKEVATIYSGNQNSFRCVDKKFAPQSEEQMKWLSNWIADAVSLNQTSLFLAGNSELISSLSKQLNSRKIEPEVIPGKFLDTQANQFCKKIRSLLKLESRMKLEKTLQEFKIAQNYNLSRTNLFEIAKKAMQGQVKKLVISDEINIFGKLNPRTGQLKVHMADLDHEDDDLLDDIAQVVLSFGGEVVVAKLNEIPNNRPIIALLNNNESEVVIHPKEYQRHLDT